MGVFINPSTKLSRCNSLGDQIRVRAMRIGGGWEAVREELATTAEAWFGSEPTKTKAELRSVCREIFRID